MSKKFRVTVEKMLLQSGVIEVSAEDAPAALKKVFQDVYTGRMQTTDKRITWDDPEYIDNSFQTTGDVEEA